MAKRRLWAIVGIVTALALMGAQPASAATQVGNQCLGNKTEKDFTIFSVTNAPGNPLPATVPSAGVITRWTFNVAPIPPGVLSQTLKILRPTGVPGQFQVVGESGLTPIVGGLNTFTARISVQAGDHLGTYGTATTETVTVFCETGNPGDAAGAFAGNIPVGSSGANLGNKAGSQIPITATVEPDADNDGFGDETQDQCPQSASTQVPCPVVALSASSVVKKTFARILVTSNIQAPVTVKGTVNLGKGKKARLNGGTQIVVPGTIAKFTLLFPGSLKSALKTLSRKQSLQLALTATAPNVVGVPTTKKLKAKVRGQKKPARKGKRKGGKRG